VNNLARTDWNDRIASVRVVAARPVAGGGWGDGVRNGGSWGYPQEPSTGACFYEDANYRGQYFCSDMGTRMAQVPYGSNSRISSIRIFGNAQVTVYPTRGFRGGYRQFGSSVSNLDRTGWNDSIESIRVEPRSYSDGFDPEDSSWNRGRSVMPSVGACFYQDADYQGQYFCTRAGVAQPDLPAEALNQVSSIRVFGDAVVTLYMQQDFRGQSRTVTSDVRNLDGTGWNDRIESFRISSRNSSNGGNYPPPPWRDR
jgi:Beta/Gamma crystallin